MIDNWQDIAALLSVALAGAYVARRIWTHLIRKPAGGCGGCSSCARQPEQAASQVVKLDVPKR